LLVAYSATAIWGAMLVFGLPTCYPPVLGYLTTIFAPSMWPVTRPVLIESFTLYSITTAGTLEEGEGEAGALDPGHPAERLGARIVMFIANSWLTYMMSPPRDITPTTDPTHHQAVARIANATWMPINVHAGDRERGVSGGAIVGAYASYRFLAARTDEERPHYDWMGYVGNFIRDPVCRSIFSLQFFAVKTPGYWLGREIYHTTSRWHHHDGGFMSWLW